MGMCSEVQHWQEHTTELTTGMRRRIEAHGRQTRAGCALEQQVAESGASKVSGPGPEPSLAAPTDEADTVPGPVGVQPATVDPY